MCKDGLSGPVEHGSNLDPYLNEEVEAELYTFLRCELWEDKT